MDLSRFPNLSERTVVITGITDGIGRELARRYAAAPHRLGLGRRSPEQLDAEGPPLLDEWRDHYVPVDLAERDAERAVLDALRTRGLPPIGLLIHNAGTGYYGPIAEESADSITRVLQVNLTSPLALTHALLPTISIPATPVPRRERPTIVFVSSVATALPAPEYASYVAAKAGLDGFARSLRAELRGRAEVRLVFPGATRTGLHRKIEAPLDAERFPPAAEVAAAIDRAIGGRSFAPTIGVGNRALRAVGRGAAPILDALLRRRSAPPRPPATQDPRALITGGGSGIGAACAVEFARRGYSVAIVDLDREAAERVRERLDGTGHRVVVADLTSASERAALLPAEGAPYDAVVHSAGISSVGRFERQPLPPQLGVLDLNLEAPLQLTAELLRAEAIAPGGALAFVSSLSRFVGYPGAAAYAASKEGLAAYARSLAVGLAPAGIAVVTAYPGPTRTPHARRYSPDPDAEAKRMPPERVATAIADAIERRRRVVIPGAANRALAAFGSALPRTAENLMAKVLLEALDQQAIENGEVRDR